MNAKLKRLLAGLAVGLLASAAQANVVGVVDLTGNPITNGGGTQYEASCTLGGDCILGFLGDPTVANDVSLDTAKVTGHAFSGNPTAEATFLNSLLDNMGLPNVSVPGDKTDEALGEFTTDRLYFSIKQGAGEDTFTAFFKNNSGGAVTVSFDPNNFSHYTEYGAVVPIPAAVWLFGSALLGIAGIGARRSAKPALES